MNFYLSKISKNSIFAIFEILKRTENILKYFIKNNDLRIEDKLEKFVLFFILRPFI